MQRDNAPIERDGDPSPRRVRQSSQRPSSQRRPAPPRANDAAGGKLTRKTVRPPSQANPQPSASAQVNAHDKTRTQRAGRTSPMQRPSGSAPGHPRSARGAGARSLDSSTVRTRGSAPRRSAGSASTQSPSFVRYALLVVLALAAVGIVWAIAHPAGDAGSGSSPTAGQGASGEVSDEPGAVGIIQRAIAQAKGKEGPWSVSFSSTGDMIFGRLVSDYIDLYGGAAPLEHMADMLSKPDVTIGNLEAPLSDNTSDGLWSKDVLLISRPEAIEGLKNSDFTFLSLANNHSMDYGAPALQDTMDALDGAGIKYAGAGMTYDQAWEIAETTVDGVRIAFLSLTDVIPENFLAYESSPGVAAARIDMDYTCEVVKKISVNHDIVVVAMHWGIEYQDYITDWMQSVPAHQLVDAGADVVLGNHPHVIQGIEFYKDALISYSQGDFVFDHFSTRKTGETFILEFDVTDQGIKNVCATPVYLEDPYGIPQVVYDYEADAILDRLELISDGMNTSFEKKDDKAFITPIDESKR